MLSRSADALFWISRYIERSEGLLRILHTTYVLSLDRGPYANNSWKTILEIFSYLPKAEKAELEKDADQILEHILMDSRNANSLRIILTKARENARGMQDHLTKEVWEQVNFMYHMMYDHQLSSQLKTNQQIPAIERLLKNCLLFTGIVDSTMSRGMSWNFMNIGKYLERCLMTIDLMEQQMIDNDLSEEKDILYWRGVLFSLSGYEFHLKNYRSNEANDNVIHQVVINDSFPHSVMYCLQRIRKYLDNIIEENSPEDPAGLRRQFGRICSSVEFADVQMIRGMGAPAFLKQTGNHLREFAWALSQTYFSYS
ncbi:MAG: alpha-E domain-containing protein [Chitinophagaceae bacterium]|jgi:uncharacterized alpha-E superfamily protein